MVFDVIFITLFKNCGAIFEKSQFYCLTTYDYAIITQISLRQAFYFLCGGSLFDFNKLNDISKEIVAQLTPHEVYKDALAWARKHDENLASLLEKYPDYSEMIFSIDRGSEVKVRKDISKWSDVVKGIDYFFDENFHIEKKEILDILSDFSEVAISEIIHDFINSYEHNDSKDVWFGKIKQIAKKHNYAESVKEFKKNHDQYRGTVADIARVFRVLLTGRKETPDLWSIMQVMGQERMFKRLEVMSG